MDRIILFARFMGWSLVESDSRAGVPYWTHPDYPEEDPVLENFDFNTSFDALFNVIHKLANIRDNWPMPQSEKSNLEVQHEEMDILWENIFIALKNPRLGPGPCTISVAKMVVWVNAHKK